MKKFISMVLFFVLFVVMYVSLVGGEKRTSTRSFIERFRMRLNMARVFAAEKMNRLGKGIRMILYELFPQLQIIKKSEIEETEPR